MSRGRKRPLSPMTGFRWSDEDEEREPVKPMAPHDDAKAKIELFGWAPEAPTIVLSHDAYLDMQGIVQEAGNDEIGWMGTVEKIDATKYRIEKIFILEQEVSGSHCEFDTSAYGKLCYKLTNGGKDNRGIVEKMLFWGHLHPGDMTEPSGQDDEMLKEFKENNFFLRGIFTRGGKCVFTFVDYKKGFLVYDCPWEAEIVDSERQKRIRGEIQKKVSSFRRTNYFPSPTVHILGQRLDIRDTEAPSPPPDGKEEANLAFQDYSAGEVPTGGQAEEKEAKPSYAKDNEGAKEVVVNNKSSKGGGGASEASQEKERAPGTPPPLPPINNVEIQFDGK